MSFSSDVSKLLTNKYFLYFIVFLTATNILGYLVTNKLNAIVFFALVGLITYQFSKNMAIILLVAIVATNFMMSSKMMREGLENGSPALEKASERDPDIKTASDAVKNSTSNAEAKEKLKSAAAPAANTQMQNIDIIDPNNNDLNTSTEEAGAPEGFGEKMSNGKGKGSNKSGPRLDYAATIEQSYGHLDEVLGGDAIKQLTKDTQSLMSQQQNLFNTMNQMVPVLEGAQNMLKGFDIGGLANSLGSFKDLGKVLNKSKEEKK